MLTTLDEIADGIYRISTFVPEPEVGPDGFTFNQFLLDAEEPLFYHTGMKGLFPLDRQYRATRAGRRAAREGPDGGRTRRRRPPDAREPR